MTRDEAIQIGFPIEWLPSDLTIEEACINRCDDCGRVIDTYPDARWRVQPTPCRCRTCAEKQQKTGCTWFEARYAP